MDFLKEIGIDKIGFVEEDKYVVELDNSNDYQQVFELLELSELVSLDEDNVEFDEDMNKATYKNEKYEINLIANFKEDSYKIEVREVR